MNINNLKCPGCGRYGTTIVVGSHVQSGAQLEEPDSDFQVSFSIELACSCRDCGYGRTIIDVDTSPLEWLQNMFDYLPQVGEPVKVEVDEETGNLLAFIYKNKHYDIAKTILSHSVPKPESLEHRNTFYLVEFQGGDALLKKEEGVPTDSNQQAVDIWFIIDHYVKSGAPIPQKLPARKPSSAYLSRKYATESYSILYEIETLLRNLIEQSFPDLGNAFKTVSISRSDNKQENLLKKLQEAREREQSECLDAVLNFSLIQYIEWWDLIEFVRQKWDVLFPSKEAAKTAFIQDLQNIRGIRNKVAHMRALKREDIDSLKKTLEKFNKISLLREHKQNNLDEQKNT
jgi:hypothetical protein